MSEQDALGLETPVDAALGARLIRHEPATAGLGRDDLLEHLGANRDQIAAAARDQLAEANDAQAVEVKARDRYTALKARTVGERLARLISGWPALLLAAVAVAVLALLSGH